MTKAVFHELTYQAYFHEASIVITMLEKFNLKIFNQLTRETYSK